MKIGHTAIVLALLVTACSQHQVDIPAIPDVPHYVPTAKDFLESDTAILVYPERPKAEVSPVDLPLTDMVERTKPPKPEKPQKGKRRTQAQLVATEPDPYAGKRTPGTTIVTFPYARGAEYQIPVAVNHPVTLLLPVGLVLGAPVVLYKGTDERPEWQVGFTRSGEEETYQEKLIINPGMAGLDASTPLLFKSGHFFVVHLKSQEKGGMLAATWEVPQSQPLTASVSAPAVVKAQLPGRKPPKIALDRLHIQYEIKPGKTAVAWTPVEVYDDGILTVIRFPESLQFTSAPVLVAVEDKRTIPIEYTTFYVPEHPEKGEFYITRGLYPRLRLLDGKGGSVEITRLPTPPVTFIKDVRSPR